ncbi:hypothetical protein I352_06084 [Cryptococcus deuterogattii MMRL2647]|nr:hypothetical protein I352_06084 [Cryptococcus deuterogattii MMRL2647]
MYEKIGRCEAAFTCTDDFSKDDLVKAMDLEPSINIGRSRWEMHLGMPGSEESFLKRYYELLISKTRWIDSRASSVKAGIETLNSHEGDFDKRVSILSRALLKQLAEKRIAQSAYDTVTANVLDTPQRTKDALVDIMSNTE